MPVVLPQISYTSQTNEDNLSKLKPQDISNTAWAMAVLGMKHRPFLEAANLQFVERARRYTQGNQNSMTFTKGQELANLLWAFAILNFPVHDLGTVIADYMLKATGGSSNAIKTESISRVFKRMELANIAWSCAVFDDFPPALIKFLYCGLVGIGEESDKGRLQQCFNDGGLQREAIMSLIYLQLALELEKKNGGLSLPEHFPEGWSRESMSRDASGLGDTTFELNLSTSKIQRDVSAAFGRIDFDHVIEHVIPLEELLQNNGVHLASTPLDVISIDIANVKAAISVEVDGPPHFVADITGGEPYEGGFAKVNKGRLEYYFNMRSDRNPVNGPTALKKRLLQRLGWRTINIPFWEWYDMNGDSRCEEEYCRRLLDEVN
jgi:RAP domain